MRPTNSVKPQLLAKRIVAAAEQHAADTGESEHLQGDLEEVLTILLTGITAAQFRHLAPKLQEMEVGQIKRLLCQCNRMHPLGQVFRVQGHCRKCGCEVLKGYCTDHTCPYSDWPQKISPVVFGDYSDREIESRFGVQRRRARKKSP